MNDLKERNLLKIEARLLQHTPLSVALWAIRNCYDSFAKSDTLNKGFELTSDLSLNDINLIKNKIMSSGHYSTLEHVTYTFETTFSRGILQEWSRHRIKSQSTKSTRYTLSKLRSLLSKIVEVGDENYQMAREYIKENIIDTTNPEIIELQIDYLINCRKVANLSNDEFKSALPESWGTRSVDTFNIRSLRNFFELRSSPRAHKDIVELSRKMYDTIPDNHKFLFQDIMEG